MARVIRGPELKTITGLSRSTVWRLEKMGRFPKRLKLGNYSVGWREADVEDWIKALSTGVDPQGDTDPRRIKKSNFTIVRKKLGRPLRGLK